MIFTKSDGLHRSKEPALVPVLNQTIQVYIFTRHSYKINFITVPIYS
jgi:hypothetical protein